MWSGSCLVGSTPGRFGHAHEHCANIFCRCSANGQLLHWNSPRSDSCKGTGIPRREQGGVEGGSNGCASVRGHCFRGIRLTCKLSNDMDGRWLLIEPGSVTCRRDVSSAGPRPWIRGWRCVHAWVATDTCATFAFEVWELWRVETMLKQHANVGGMRCTSIRVLWCVRLR